MFTGIVQGTLKITNILQNSNVVTLKLKATQKLREGLIIGASVAINGCCLTVTKITKEEVSFDIIPETINRTTFATLKINDLVNYERSAKFNDEIGGHIVSGHIHDSAKVLEVVGEHEKTITIEIPKKWEKYIFYKGYIAINGCSLTIGEKQNNILKIHLIPETLKTTTFKFIKPQDLVNIEIDTQTIVTVDTVYNVLRNL